jgi:murein DD-endopeptidase MepM/ murein hydrolase activator NlpD
MKGNNFSLVLTVLMSVYLSACSHLRSGHFVKLGSGHNVKFLAQYYEVSESGLKAANPDSAFEEGEWVFIPQSRGIFSKIWGEKPFFSKQYGGEGQFLWPVPESGKISSLYGPRGGKFHQGIDIPAATGSDILAVEEGEVIYARHQGGGYGNLVMIQHPNDIVSLYAHSQRILVSEGDKVSRGEKIALVGSTGRSSGPHLHLEIRNKERTLDPIVFFPTPGGGWEKFIAQGSKKDFYNNDET